jgi:hypothetical protein
MEERPADVVLKFMKELVNQLNQLEARVTALERPSPIRPPTSSIDGPTPAQSSLSDTY